MHDKLLSIIIVNYNVRDFLLQSLRSIEKSAKGLDYEVIIVDNNSIDGSVEYLKNYFPQFTFIALDKNVGFGKANNIGIEQAKGKYILILNPDTILQEDTLTTMIKYMELHPEVGIAGCKILNSDGSFQVACRRGFPTPWVAFTKLFGLQSLFPKSKIFAKYNQLFKDENEESYVDSIVGAFMFARSEALRKVKGFDEDFFLYGEDIDLCYRITKAGWKVAYTPSTSIIHFKGESTRRSNINEIKHFYKAMEIFAKKHFRRSLIFLLFLKLGIFIRSLLTYIRKNFLQFFIIVLDLTIVNLSLIIATKIKFGRYFGFPDYAYPTVFFVISAVIICSMIAVGEYFEKKPVIRKALFGFMVSFFVLSSLTYFFKDYAFSRGVLLMTIAFSIILSSLARAIINLYEKLFGKFKDKRIAIIGTNPQAKNIIQHLQTNEAQNTNIVGIITTNITPLEQFEKLPIIGYVNLLNNIIDNYNIHEIIVTENKIETTQLITLISQASKKNVKFHIIKEYDELISSRIIQNITGTEAIIPQLNINKFRNKLIKRTIDIIISALALFILSPIFLFANKEKRSILQNFKDVFLGKKSIIGLYPVENYTLENGKIGLIGMAHISNPERLSSHSIRHLNDYYLQNFSLSLDLDILLKFIFRKKNAN